MAVIRSYIYTDDRVFELDEFDVTDYFREATKGEILTLAKRGWGGSPADKIVDFFSNVEEIKIMLMYLHRVNHKSNAPGFECHVYEDDALRWLKEYRPDIYAEII